MKEQIIEAAMLHFDAERAQIQTNLNMYLLNPVGVAEHPNIVQEVVALTKKLAEAEECIKLLAEKYQNKA